MSLVIGDRYTIDNNLQMAVEYDNRSLAILNTMGIEVWVPRDAARSEAAVAVAQATVQSNDVAAMGWDQLRETVAACTRCELHRARTQTVFGIGDQKADWLFIGEAPGADEDRQGEPFVGRAGKLLNNIFKAIGLSREQVYIANILKCRPPKNRDPKPEESQCCHPYLKRQIELLQPRIIVALGRIAAQNLLHTNSSIGKMRGRQFFYDDTDIPIIVTYHPAYLLRSPGQKRKVWDDLRFAKSLTLR